MARTLFFFGKQCSLSQLIVLRRPAHHTMVTHIPRLGVRGLASVGLLLWNNAFSVLGVHRRHLDEYSLLLSTLGWKEIEVLGGLAAADHKGQSYL